MILLIVSVLLIGFGVTGLIVVSNRKNDRNIVDRNTDYRDMLRRVLWASEGTWQIDEYDRAKWPEIDQMVMKARVDPETRERIRNDWLPGAERNLQDAWDVYHRTQDGIRTGVNNGAIIVTAGGVLFVVWVIWAVRGNRQRKRLAMA